MSEIFRITAMLCERKGTTVAELCKRHHISYDRFAQVDNDENAYLPATTVKSISSELGVTPAYLYGYDEKAKQDLERRYGQLSRAKKNGAKEDGTVANKNRHNCSNERKDERKTKAQPVKNTATLLEMRASAERVPVPPIESIHIPKELYDCIDTFSVRETESGKYMLILQKRYELLELLKIAVDMTPDQVVTLIEFLKEMSS